MRKDGRQSDGLKVKQKVSYDVEPGHHGGQAVHVANDIVAPSETTLWNTNVLTALSTRHAARTVHDHRNGISYFPSSRRAAA